MIFTEEADKILAANRKPHRIFIFNVDSEIRLICFPSYRRREKLMFNTMQSTRTSNSAGEQR